MISRLTIAVALLIALPVSTPAASIETRRVSFAPGTSSASVTGSIRGDSIVDHKLGAKAGQTVRVGVSLLAASRVRGCR